MEKLATITHTLFCEKEHFYNLEGLREAAKEPSLCLFYIEEAFDQTWEMRDHKNWLEKTKSLLEELEIQDPQEAFFLLTKLLSAMKPLSEFITLNPQLKNLSIRLLQEV